MSKILYPLSLAYSALSKTDRKFSSPRKLSKPVISVGNLTWGGTGKTPIVIELLKLLTKNNIKPAVLTRGYYRKSRKPVLLKNGALEANVLKSGDEPLLIAKSVPLASVIVGSDRYNNALKFEREVNPDVYVLDDGFQCWNVYRDLDIVCINAANPFGNGMLIPAGILREKPAALKRAGFIIITNSDMVSSKKLEELKRVIFSITKQFPAVTYYGGFEYKTTDLNTDFSVEILKNSQVYALSAIGFAKGFKNSIKKSGVTVKDSIILRDHSIYKNSELRKIIKHKGQNAYFIVTAKDAVKYQNIDEDIKERIAVLVVKPQFEKRKQEWEREVLKCLQFS